MEAETIFFLSATTLLYLDELLGNGPLLLTASDAHYSPLDPYLTLGTTASSVLLLLIYLLSILVSSSAPVQSIIGCARA